MSDIYVTTQHKSYYQSSLVLKYHCIHFGFHASFLINFVPVPSKLYSEHKNIQEKIPLYKRFSQYTQVTGKCVFLSFPPMRNKETKSFKLSIFPQHDLAELDFHVNENCADNSMLSVYWHIEVCMTSQANKAGCFSLQYSPNSHLMHTQYSSNAHLAQGHIFINFLAIHT